MIPLGFFMDGSVWVILDVFVCVDSLDSASAIFAISVDCLSVCSTKILHGNLASIMCSVCMIIDVNSQFFVYFFPSKPYCRVV